MEILILAPHTDDGEFGCGGAICKFISEGHNVCYVAFSAAETSVSPEYPTDVLRKEVLEATKVLGISKEAVTVFKYPVRQFSDHRQSILDDMIDMNRVLSPDMVFLPSTVDTHQDHQVVREEAFRAFKKTTMFGYELPWNNINFSCGAFIRLTQHCVSKKITALGKYISQSNRPYATPDFITSLATVRGVQIGAQYAEAFEVIRWIL